MSWTCGPDADNKGTEGERKESQSGVYRYTPRMEGEERQFSARPGAATVTGSSDVGFRQIDTAVLSFGSAGVAGQSESLESSDSAPALESMPEVSGNESKRQRLESTSEAWEAADCARYGSGCPIPGDPHCAGGLCWCNGTSEWAKWPKPGRVVFDGLQECDPLSETLARGFVLGRAVMRGLDRVNEASDGMEDRIEELNDLELSEYERFFGGFSANGVHEFAAAHGFGGDTKVVRNDLTTRELHTVVSDYCDGIEELTGWMDAEEAVFVMCRLILDEVDMEYVGEYFEASISIPDHLDEEKITRHAIKALGQFQVGGGGRRDAAVRKKRGQPPSVRRRPRPVAPAPKKKREKKIVMRNPKRVQSISTDVGITGLTRCAAMMLTAIANPWSPEAQGACIPTAPARPTMKTTSFLRTNVVVGTANTGWVLVSPTVANNMTALQVTNATYNGVIANPVADAATPVQNTQWTPVDMPNLPFPSGQLWSGAMNEDAGSARTVGRIVAIGVSVQYTGTELDLGGTVTCYSSPTRLNLLSATQETLLGYVDADLAITTSSRHKCWLVAFPTEANEMTFDVEERLGNNQINSNKGQSALYYPLSGGNTNTPNNTTTAAGGFPMGICITGKPGVQYQVEVVAHVEYYGPATQAMSTPSIADPEGLAKVISAASKAPQIKQARGFDWKKAVIAGLKEAGRELLPIAGKAVLAMLA